MSKFALQHFSPAIIATGLLLAGQQLHAQNKYDILARAVQPYGALFYSKAPTKAMQADVVLREGTLAAAEFLNQPLRDPYRFQTNSALRRLIPSTALSSAATDKLCGHIPATLRLPSLPGESPTEQPGSQIFACRSKTKRSYLFRPSSRFSGSNLDQIQEVNPSGSCISGSFRN